MSDDLRALLAVGTRLAHDGQWWQVSELDGPHVLLASQAGHIRRVSAATCSPIRPPGCRKRQAAPSRALVRS